MACKHIYKGITYNSKEEFIEKVINPQVQTLNKGVYILRDSFTNELYGRAIYKKEAEDMQKSLSKDWDKPFYIHTNTAESENQFLQLLNKDNNWVTFFVKSIIQDSAKKGYEKVLFPTGNTSIKIESPGTGISTIEDAKNQDQKALANTGLFYENTLTNILKKNYKINEITDEYGNTWNEITITSKDLDNILLQTKSETTVTKKNTKLEQDLKEFATINGIKIEFIDSLVEKFGGDYAAAYDSVNKVVYVNENKAGLDTLGEEIAHSLTLALGSEHMLVKKAFNLLSRTDYKSSLDPEYVKLYKNNEDALKHEVIGKMIAQILVRQYEPKTQAELTLFQSLMQIINKFISMCKRNDRLKDVVQSLAAKITNKEQVFVGDVKVTGSNAIYFQIDPKKDKSKIEDKNQYVYLKQQLNKDLKTLNKLEYDSSEHILLRDKVDKNTKALAELEASGNKQIIIDLGSEMLDNLERLLNDSEDVNNKTKLDSNTISASFETFRYFKVFPPLAQRSLELENRLSILSRISMLEDINLRALEGREITADEAFGVTQDIGSIKGAFAKLSNSSNYIARTIHLMIKEVQDNVSNQDKQTNKLIKSEVELLREWSKSNNISEKEMYDIFIQDHRGSTILTRQFTAEFYEMIDKGYAMDKDKRKVYINTFAKWDPTIKMYLPKSNKFINSNYTKIQKTPALKKFYDFHKKLVKEAADKLPVKIDPEFIANIASNNLLDAFKVDAITKSDKLMEMASNLTGINVKQFQDGTFALDEGLFQDIIPMQFVASLDKSKKSYNLGDNLNTFVKFANNYEQMSNVLPTIRTMQNQLGKQSFIKSNDPNKAIEGLNSDTGVKSNIYEFVNTVIEMQVKGNMKKDQGTVKTTAILDKDGNITGYNYIHGSHIADFGMKYNSLLRIGLNPINAITNLIIGDLGNIIEGFGNRFYSLTNLKDASNIFFKDVMKEDSDLNKWRELIGPLQEYDDYEGIKQESTSKNIFTKENIEKIMFAPQKGGEIWLQNRTMIAMLIKDGLMNPDGTSTPKGVSISKVDLQRLRNKIHDVNDKIHGRYSARDAAAITQNVLGRMALQFKKWIPAAIESRFEAHSFNNDLGVEVEGRYRVGFRLMVRALKGDLKALQSGNMTELELYSMRKNLAELTLALGTIVLFAALGSFGDDDDELKKNPYYKFTMDQLNRVSGDLLYFVNPVSATELALKPIALAKTTSDLLHAVIAIPHIFGVQGKKDIYASGSRKDENKALAKLIDLTPGAAPVARVLRNFKDIKYQSPK